MNKKSILLTLAIVAVLTVLVTAVFLLLPQKREAAGILTETDAVVYVNHEKIPSYGYDGRVFIAAEDLENFGAAIIKPEEGGNIRIAYDDNTANGETEQKFSRIAIESELENTDFLLYIGDSNVEHYTVRNYNIIPVEALKKLEHTLLKFKDSTYLITMSMDITEQDEGEADQAQSGEPQSNEVRKNDEQTSRPKKSAPVIVLDPGHGRSSSSMDAGERESSGWVYNSAKGQWGEWRHWKNDTVWEDCEGSGCNKYGDCWYPIGNGDRSTEPEINLTNCLAAKKYLEELGYTVRLTRSAADENPSITKRISYCYPECDTSAEPDAAMFICVHSNAGGGRGSAYIELSGDYKQKGIKNTYSEDGNRLGKMINDEIVETTSLSQHGSGKIPGEGYLIAFNKSPVTCGYLEIGFFDSESDLAILRSESDKIGKAIANGVDKFMKSE